MSIELDSASLVAGAQTVLRTNDLGGSTKPAPALYPHQWNWDSCFIAMGIAHYDPARALQEIEALLRGQWGNGMVPQIIFNPEASGYFPGPDVWQSERSADAPTGIATSGITQPPVLATAVRRVCALLPDASERRDTLARLFPRIRHYHDFFYRHRNPDRNGLIVVIHPWESGLDNSPPYLDAGQRVTLTYKPAYERLDLLHVAAKNRPTNKDYDLFVWLLEQMRAVDWDQDAYLAGARLQVQDVLFNAVLCRANLDLAAIANEIGEDATEATAWYEQTRQAINAVCWDEADGTYYDFDRVAGHLLRDRTIAGLHALYGQIAPAERAERLIAGHLLPGQTYCAPEHRLVPTTACDSPWFNPENYWLGPVWVNTNWMIVQGLKAYGHDELAETLKTRTLELVAGSGYREYYNPFSGEGYGTDSFSWTAALTIDLLSGSD